MGARVIALGQAAAGDDGVGLAVLERLLGRVPDDVELCAAADSSDLVLLLATPRSVVLVDALFGEPVGAVCTVSTEALDSGSHSAISSHGLGVGQAIALARALFPDAVAPRVSIVAVTIAPPTRYREALSPEVAAAVEHAAALALALVGG